MLFALAAAPVEHTLLEALLEGEPPPAEWGPPKIATATSRESDSDGGVALGADAITKAAATEEDVATAAAVARERRAVAREASANALLMELERRTDDAFRAHEARVWQVMRPKRQLHDYMS